jgi:hypothetical protein
MSGEMRCHRLLVITDLSPGARRENLAMEIERR